MDLTWIGILTAIIAIVGVFAISQKNKQTQPEQTPTETPH